MRGGLGNVIYKEEVGVQVRGKGGGVQETSL